MSDVKKNFNEINVTNLGKVPEGVSFWDATLAIKNNRKYFINPNEGGHRLTVCDTLRTMYKLLDKIPDSFEKEQMREYISQCYDYGKRMNQRMLDLKQIILDIDPNYKE